MSARIHETFAHFDQRKIQVGDHFAFAAAQRLADDAALGIDDGGEAAAGDRTDRTAGVLGDLRLLLCVEPGGRGHDEASGFERVLAHVDLGLFGEKRTGEGARIHRRVDLFAVGDERVARQGQIVLPARQLADAADGAVDGTQPGCIALPPHHALVIGRRELAAALYERAVGIEQQLRVVDRVAVALVHADRHDHVRLARGRADRIGFRRRNGHRFVQEAQVFLALHEGRLDEREIRIVGNHRFREGRELDAFFAQLSDFLDDFFDGPGTAVQHGTDLDGGGFYDGHDWLQGCRSGVLAMGDKLGLDGYGVNVQCPSF